MSKVIGIKRSEKEKDGTVYTSYYLDVAEYKLNEESGRGFSTKKIFCDSNAIDSLKLNDFRDIVGKEIDYYLNKKFKSDSPDIVGFIKVL